MKILFLSLNHSHLFALPFATELELISHHLDQKDEVFILVDDGVLKSTSANPHGLFATRVRGKARFFHGMQIVNFPRENIFRLKRKLSYKKLPQNFDSLEELENYSLFGVDFGLGVASSLISLTRDHKVDVRQYRGLVNNLLWSAVLVYESVKEMLLSLQPDVFYFFNGRYAEIRPALRASEQLGIRYCIYEKGWSLHKYALYHNNSPHDLHHLADLIEKTWEQGDNKREQIAENWFIRQSQAKTPEWYLHTNYQQHGSLPSGFDHDKCNIAIFNSSLDEYATFPSYQNHIYKEENEGIKRVVEDLQSHKHIQFYLRIHPNLKNADNNQIRTLRAMHYPNLHIIWPEETVDSYALMKSCNKIVVFISTVGVEACYWGIPAILAGKAYYQNLDCCYIPQTHEENLELLVADLPPKPKANALKYGYWRAMHGIDYQKYEPDPSFNGKFLGQHIEENLPLADKLVVEMINTLWKCKQWVKAHSGK